MIGMGTAIFGPDVILWGFGAAKKIVGANGQATSLDNIPADGFGPIAVSWIVSPVIAGIFAAIMFWLTRTLILRNNFISVRIHKHPFWRTVYLAPFFYAFVAAVLVVLLAFKGVSSNSNAGGLGKIANADDQLAAAAAITGVVVGLLSSVYVSWWQVRTNWRGEDIKAYEYPYFWLLKARPTRANFDASHLDENFTGVIKNETHSSSSAVPSKGLVIRAADSTAEGNVAEPIAVAAAPSAEPQAAPAEELADPTIGSSKVEATTSSSKAFSLAKMTKFMTDTNGYERHVKNAPTLEQVKIEVVHPAIAAAQAIATEAGYVIRPMGETEKVMIEYKKICVNGTWLDRLLCPIRGLLCHGVIGAGNEERTVMDYGASDPTVQAMHDTAEKFDPHTERFFMQLQMLTCCIASFSHGSNDVANAMGPFTVIWSIYSGLNLPSSGSFTVTDGILAFGGASISLGFLVYGYHLMRTLGNTLTFHSPSRGYSMEFGAAITVLLASRIGIPISTTQCITGATMGVGLLSGRRAVNFKRFAQIFGSWVITVPTVGTVSGLLTAFIVYSPNVWSPNGWTV